LAISSCNLIIPWLGPPMSPRSVANNFWPAPVPVNYLKMPACRWCFKPRAFRASAFDVCASNAEFGAQQPRYGDLFTPTIIITAEKDKIVSPKRHARALAVDMPAAELVIAPDTGHMPHRLRTDLIIAAIRRVNEMTSAAVAGLASLNDSILETNRWADGGLWWNRQRSRDAIADAERAGKTAPARRAHRDVSRKRRSRSATTSRKATPKRRRRALTAKCSAK
jgi:hypothetical protein